MTFMYRRSIEARLYIRAINNYVGIISLSELETNLRRSDIVHANNSHRGES